MATSGWRVAGEYFETCNCDFICPCIATNLAATPSGGHCTFAMVFHVEEGQYGGERLDDLSFVVVGNTPSPMIEGGWSVGVIVDERASQAKRDALVAIASGQAGGPMGSLGPLVGQFLGAESRPIAFQKSGLSRSVSVPGMLDEAVEGVPSAVRPGEPIYLDNTLHPSNSRVAVARATRSHLHGFGLNWDDVSARNNGHFARFEWTG
jgi:hypothetical protein